MVFPSAESRIATSPADRDPLSWADYHRLATLRTLITQNQPPAFSTAASLYHSNKFNGLIPLPHIHKPYSYPYSYDNFSLLHKNLREEPLNHLNNHHTRRGEFFPSGRHISLPEKFTQLHPALYHFREGVMEIYGRSPATSPRAIISALIGESSHRYLHSRINQKQMDLNFPNATPPELAQ